jgi:hypothetical protein
MSTDEQGLRAAREEEWLLTEAQKAITSLKALLEVEFKEDEQDGIEQCQVWLDRYSAFVSRAPSADEASADAREARARLQNAICELAFKKYDSPIVTKLMAAIDDYLAAVRSEKE